MAIWERFFKKQKKATEPVRTAPLPDDQIETVVRETVHYHPPQLIVACGQSVGLQREHNEDTLFTLHSTLSGQGESIPFGLFVIADGMGGYQHGEIASETAVRAFTSVILKKLILPYYSVSSDIQDEPLQEILRSGIQHAQQTVLKIAAGGGTTLTAALIMGEQVTFAHIGDSRAYFLYPDGRVQAVTRDHSLVRRLQELGQLTEQEAAVHPQRNVLYKALGQIETVDADIHTNLVPRPGYLLLCSDGLWNVVSETDIFRIVREAGNPTEACHRLVQAANDAGGPDNISVILVQCPA